MNIILELLIDLVIFCTIFGLFAKLTRTETVCFSIIITMIVLIPYHFFTMSSLYLKFLEIHNFKWFLINEIPILLLTYWCMRDNFKIHWNYNLNYNIFALIIYHIINIHFNQGNLPCIVYLVILGVFASMAKKQAGTDCYNRHH